MTKGESEDLEDKLSGIDVAVKRKSKRKHMWSVEFSC